jgi:NAD(P)-dependent dehydrogenase (short-subunit alcohol dehydrogenase family)
MAGHLAGKVAIVVGSGGDAHRGVAVALAEAGADVAIAGTAPDLAAEAALHSISNEIWAIGRRSAVVKLAGDDAPSFAAALSSVMQELGRADLVVRCEPVLSA